MVGWCEEIEGVYKEAEDLGRIRQASAGRLNYEYAALTSRAKFSDSSKDFIKYWGPLWLGRRHDGKNYVFCDYVPKELHDQIGLHEALHDIGPNGIDHQIACKEELRWLERNPELYKKAAEFWVKFNQRKRKPYSIHYNLGVSYFVDEIPDLMAIIKKGKMSPEEILKLFQKTLNEKYAHVEAGVEF